LSASFLIKYDVSQKKTRLTVILLGSLCFLSTIIVGRTGLLICVITLFFLFFINSKKIKLVSFFTLIIIVAYIADLSAIFERVLGHIPGFSYQYFSEWVSDAFSISDNTTVEYISGMPIPPLELKTLLGTGEIVAPDGSNASR